MWLTGKPPAVGDRWGGRLAREGGAPVAAVGAHVVAYARRREGEVEDEDASAEHHGTAKIDRRRNERAHAVGSGHRGGGVRNVTHGKPRSLSRPTPTLPPAPPPLLPLALRPVPAQSKLTLGEVATASHVMAGGSAPPAAAAAAGAAAGAAGASALGGAGSSPSSSGFRGDDTWLVGVVVVSPDVGVCCNLSI